MQAYWWKRNNFHRRGAEAQGRRRGNGVLNICIDEQLELDFNQRLKIKNQANILNDSLRLLCVPAPLR